MPLLKDKVAVITGAGGGIGRGVARCFAREGAAVLIAEIDEASGMAVERELKELGGRAHFLRTDVTRKGGVLGLTRSAACEWGRFNITVNAIAPTAMGATFHKLAAENPGFAERSAAARPLGRSGDPELDIGPVVVFLASEMARYVTGESIHVDGGLHLPGYNSRPANVPVRER